MFLTNRFTQKTLMLGCWASKGVMKESNRAYDSTKVRLMCLDKVSGGAQALGFEDLAWGDSSNFEHVKHLNPAVIGPVEVEVELEEQHTKVRGQDGRDRPATVRTIVSLKPVQIVKSELKKAA